MSVCEFLNLAHAVLVEEFMRPRTIKGVTISGMSLDEALESASPWAEGYDILKLAETEEVPPAGRAQASEEKSEEEIVAQNQLAMQQLMGRVSNMKGGFSKA